MDEAEADATLDKLLRLGFVQMQGDQVAPTRSWNARLQAQAAKLNAIVAKTGVAPEGNPLVLAVTQALADHNLGLPDDEFLAARDLLVTLELTRMSPAKRATMGFPAVRFDGE